MQSPDELNADGRPPMTDKTMQIETLKSRVASDQYAVDERAVADAIVTLLLRRQNECS
jgi:anti-sigma28 factor (negative regulator of flagellin synthesis)